MKFNLATTQLLWAAFLVATVAQVLGDITGEKLENVKRHHLAYCPEAKACHAIFRDEESKEIVRWRDAQKTAKDAWMEFSVNRSQCPNLKCGRNQYVRSYLVSVGSGEEQDCLEAMMELEDVKLLAPVGRLNRPWIGAVQNVTLRGGEWEPAGGFKWDSGEPFYKGFCNPSTCDKKDLEAWHNDMVFHRFASGQPDDGGSSETEHYLELHPGPDPKWGPWHWNDRAYDDVHDDPNNLYIVEYKCVPNGVHGDPHFATWLGQKFDYHGECDLELMSDPDFNNGQGMAVHIRTTIVDDWSYVEAVAIKIGDDVLEVQGSSSEAPYWINGEYRGQVESLGGFEVLHKTKGSSSRQRFFIMLDEDSTIEVRSSSLGWLRLDMNNPGPKHFGNVVGLYGDYSSGAKLGRDGVTVFEDDNEFGQEWQVPGDAPMLFHTARAPQAPYEKCILPSDRPSTTAQARLRRRKLLDLVSHEKASEACQQDGIHAADFDDCVKDVMAVNDVSIAGDYVLDDDYEDIIRPATVYQDAEE